MLEVGNMLLCNISIYSNSILEWIKSLGSPIATIIIGIFTINITVKNLRRTMLDNLDSKSGWRKTLFEIAGKDKITLDDIFKIRACLRFDTKDEPKNIFDTKTNIIIEFCKQMQMKYDKDCCKTSLLEKSDREKARIYSRYLLANHWEILQLTDKEYKKYCQIRGDSLVKINKPKEQVWYKKEQELDKKTNELINKLTP
ncbi:hypothetical protein [Mammaliicoccus sciuri]|uniref:hypothetical protein n=1 Tax=Mammaliicoccus sciuri TaxID=1296 RepID=UPI002DBBAC4A|nr:hypothetical protein [Mammaliicoccus sciuri]MEB7768496.1 hypothetical protein [Mammaliicoccus sciuri]MEB7818847.1 hypothetical protein [Mammaliicoccus sciuri]WRY62725.1 hypothetical protein P8F79_11245 [Mammaliicoccus sciuri]